MNGVPQREHVDYALEAGSLVSSRRLKKERVGFWRWTLMFFSIAGVYEKNDVVDVHYRAGGRDRSATGLDIRRAEANGEPG